MSVEAKDLPQECQFMIFDSINDIIKFLIIFLSPEFKFWNNFRSR